MKIIWITELNINTRHKSSRFELAEALRKRGHEVTLIIQRKLGESKIIKEDIVTFPTIPFPIVSKFIYGAILFFYLPLFIRNKKIDVILIDGADVWLPFVISLKLLNIPLILDIRTTTIKRSPHTILLDTSLYISKFLVRGITTITPEVKNILIKRYKIKEKDIGIWTSGVAIEKFQKNTTIPDSLKHMRETKDFIVMYHGSYAPYRGIENTINSFQYLDANLRKKIELIFVGFDAKQNRELTTYCNQLGFNEEIRFISQVAYETMPSYLSVCDVGIIPLPPENEYCWESSPLKTLEYLAMCKPIIATNIPFHKRIFDEGECGVLIENNEPETIAKAILYLYENKQKLDEMGKVGREIVENYYTWDKKALDLEKFIKTILRF
jgi:glycosyltransferase involved in cell wall biosynthesis